MGKRSKKQKKTSIIFGVLISVLVISLSVLHSQNKAQDRSALAASCQTLPLKIPVLVLGYFPPDPNNPTYIDPTETGWTTQRYNNYGLSQPLTLTQWHASVDKMITDLIPEITDNTRYHGYKDISAIPFLTWIVSDKKFFDTPIPRGVRDTEPGNPYRPNYRKILTDQNICNYVDTQGVKEVWIYSYHSDLVSPDESRMSSKYGDISNSYPNGTNVDPTLILPVCNNSYVLYNYEALPTGDIANTVHNRMHQIENTISYADGYYRTTPGGLFWGNFAEYTGQGKPVACGNTHIPPNETQAYVYSTTSSISSNCETWNPDGTKSTYAPVSCTNWGCTDQKFYKWWMQNTPGYNNGITYQGQPMRNWWEAMYDFNAFIGKSKSLLGNSLFTCFTTPTPTQPLVTIPLSSPTITANPTNSGNIQFYVTACPHGIGNCGDNTNAIGIGNITPKTAFRNVKVTLLSGTSQEVASAQAVISYNPTTQEFQGNVPISGVTPGQYLAKIVMSDYLPKQIPGIFSVTSTTTNVNFPSVSLTVGDINNDGQLDILDFNSLIGCFGSKQTSPSCTAAPNTTSSGSDINDDGLVNGTDYNLFLRELSVQKGT